MQHQLKFAFRKSLHTNPPTFVLYGMGATGLEENNCSLEKEFYCEELCITFHLSHVYISKGMLCFATESSTLTTPPP